MTSSTVAAVYDRRTNLAGRFFSASAVIDRRYRLSFIGGAAVLLTACSSAVTPEKMAQVQPGMKTAQVVALLGQPVHIDQAETTGLRGEVYDYPGVHGQVHVVLLNDAVFKTEFIPGDNKS